MTLPVGEPPGGARASRRSRRMLLTQPRRRHRRRQSKRHRRMRDPVRSSKREEVSGIAARRTSAAGGADQRQRRAPASSKSGRPSKPLPATQPATRAVSRASARSAASRRSPSMRSVRRDCRCRSSARRAARVERRRTDRARPRSKPSRARRLGQHARGDRRHGQHGAVMQRCMRLRRARFSPGARSPRFGNTSRAMAKASGKPSTTAFSASRICTSRRCWVWYLTLPIASAPMPTARVPAAAAIGRRPSRRRRRCPRAAPRSRRPRPSARSRRRDRPRPQHLHAGRRAGEHHVGLGRVAAQGRRASRRARRRHRDAEALRCSRRRCGLGPLRSRGWRAAPGARLRASTPAMRPTGPVPPRINTRLPLRPRAMVLLQRGLDAGDHRRGGGVGAAGVGHQRDDEGLDHRLLRRSSMSAASSASRPPMKMPVRATPLGPREKIVSCVRPATAPGRPRHTAR